MKKFSRISNTYNKEYFLKRDILDLRMADSIEILLKSKKYKKVLDVGCGTGLLIGYLNKKGFDTYGCDIQNEALKISTKRFKGRIKKCSAARLKYPNESFDLVCAVSVIEHLNKPDVRSFLRGAWNILKPGGTLFLVTPNYATPIRLIQGKKWFGYSDPSHLTFFDPVTLGAIMKRSGYRNIKTTFKTSFNLPFDWDLPDFIRQMPSPVKNIISFLLVSTPLTIIRNSFWISGEKVHES